MEDPSHLKKETLYKLRKELDQQIEDLQRKRKLVNLEIGRRDAIMLEALAEAAYQRDKLPTDPPTLEEYWRQRNENSLQDTAAKSREDG